MPAIPDTSIDFPESYDFQILPSLEEDYHSALSDYFIKDYGEPCHWCYDLPSLRANYSDILRDYEIRLIDPHLVPDDILGFMSPYFKKIFLRKDLAGKLTPLYFRGRYKGRDVTGYVLVPSIEIVAAHELQHAKKPDEASEYEIDSEAREKTKDFYLSYIV